MVVGEGNGVVISLIYCVLRLHSHSFLSWNDLLYLYIHTTKNTKKWPFSRFSGYDVNRNNYHFGHTRKNLLKFAIHKHFRKSCKVVQTRTVAIPGDKRQAGPHVQTTLYIFKTLFIWSWKVPPNHHNHNHRGSFLSLSKQQWFDPLPRKLDPERVEIRSWFGVRVCVYVYSKHSTPGWRK